MPRITAFLCLILMFSLSACMTTGGATETEKLHGLWQDEQERFFFLEEGGRLGLPRSSEWAGESWDFDGTVLTLTSVSAPGEEVKQERLHLQKRGLFSVEFLDAAGNTVKWSRSFKTVKTLEGSLFFRERIMLPPEVTVSVKLRDPQSGNVAAQSVANADGRSELTFSVDYLKGDFKDNAAVDAVIFYGKEPLFASPEGTSAALDNRPAILLHHAVPSRDEKVSLKGTYWRLKELGGQPAESYADQPEAHLILQEKGEATGSDGCNNFFVGWEGDEEKLSFTPGGATLRLCPQGMVQAQKMLQMLPEVRSWNISGRELELRSEKSLEAVFEAVEM